MKIIKLHCQILSPVHIGAGFEIDPLQYIIQNNKMHKFSLDRLVASLDEKKREQFEKTIERNDLVRLRNFIADRINLERDSIYSVKVSSEIAKYYEDKINDIRNRLFIQPFIRTQNQETPIIPGSSIKGAIRTAVVNHFAQEKKSPRPRNFKEERQFESLVMGYKDAKNDPFRGIKIRDVQLDNDYMQVTMVKNMGKVNNGNLKPTGVTNICETTASVLSNESIIFSTELLLDDNLFSSGFIKNVINPELISQSCHTFYFQKLKREHEDFYKGNEIEGSSKLLLDKTFENNSFLLRLGRFSGVESVTLDEYRNPRPPGKNRGWGKTRNLEHGKLPMGWVKVTIE